MSDYAIKVEDLSKSYLIGHQAEAGYRTFREMMVEKGRMLGNRIMHPFKSAQGGVIGADSVEEFFALRDVSFEIKPGDRVGIIGRNGAGKSTLLKVLSRITEPTSGRISIRGRVASLLEVGTGFHPELTGRENIFLNGAVLGMTKAEIKRKFDEIVDFAEVERFLDTPVKRYSSGMYVRLAFAVAAHLEPEILVVDEVLAVGDAQFQKKCLGKMEEVGRQGRTVLFVSHNMATIQQLCVKSIMLQAGEVKMIGNTNEVVDFYVGAKTSGSCSLQTAARKGNLGRRAKIKLVEIVNSENYEVDDLKFCEDFKIRIEADANEAIDEMRFDISVHSLSGAKILTLISNERFSCRKGDTVCGSVNIRNTCLTPGGYTVRAALRLPYSEMVDSVLEAKRFTILPVSNEHNVMPIQDEVADKGLLQLPKAEWEIGRC